MNLRLTQTITKNGKFYLEGYIPYGKTTREFFSIREMTRDETYALLYRMQEDIDKMRPRRQGAKR